MAASGLLDAVNSVLTAIGEIPYDWAEEDILHSRPTKLFQLVRMWNNQVLREKDGTGYTFEKPACFLELRSMDNSMLLSGVSLFEYIWRFHIVDMQLDAGNESGMDQNLSVLAYRDALIQAMGGFTPANCSTLFPVNEEQDYEHTDVYHYIKEMKSAFTDTKGSDLDPDQTVYIYKEPPTNLELISSFDTGVTPAPAPLISYIWKVCMIMVEIVETPDGQTQTLDNGVVIPLQYAPSDPIYAQDGITVIGYNKLTIPYLISTPGIAVLTPFLLDQGNIQDMPYDSITGTFDATEYNGFHLGSVAAFNASLPEGVN